MSGLWTFIFILLLVAAFFSLAETSMMASNRYRLRHLAMRGNRSAHRVLSILQRPEFFLNGILIGNTLSNVATSSAFTLWVVRGWGEEYLAPSTIVFSLILLIGTEVFPKTLGAKQATPWALRIGWLVQLVLKLLFPLIWLSNLCNEWLMRLFKGSEREAEHLSRDEILNVLREGSDVLSFHQADLLRRVLEVDDIRVEMIMVPKRDWVGLDLDQDWEDLLKTLETTDMLHLPVYERHPDQLKGVLNVRHWLHHMEDYPDKEAMRGLLQAPYFIPEGTRLTEQLSYFKAQGERIAFVVDEYGSILGLLTLEHLIEELVGDLNPAWSKLSSSITPQEEGVWMVDGSISLRELNRELEINLPLEQATTLSGLIINRLEGVPEHNLCLAFNDCQMEILKIEEKRIKSVRLSRLFPR